LNLIRIVLLLLLVPTAFSWDWTTHQYAARELCDYLSCGACLPDILNGSIAPDRDFKDFSNHHCYSPLWNCPTGDWVCPDKFDCPALEKSDYWLAKSKEDSGCDRFYDIGVASHYFLDSKVFWHQVMSEDYEGCHAKFEELVGEKIGTDFDIWVCSVHMNSSIFQGYVQEFESKLGPGFDYTYAALFLIALVLVFVITLKLRK